MPRKAEKPPREEWERHKETILSLAPQHSWKVISEKMERDHHFIARPEHYDAQMRAWGAHKNLKQQEWRNAIYLLDDLASRNDGKVRMRILGNIVSEERIRRSRRRYCQVLPDADGVVPSHVSYDILGTDGGWSLLPKNNNIVSAIEASDLDHALGNIAPNALFSSEDDICNGVSILQGPEKPIILPMNENSNAALHFPSRRNSLNSDTSATGCFFSLNEQISPSILSPSMLRLSPPCSPLFPYDISLNSPFQWSSFLHSDLLNDLPFKKFQDSLKMKGIHLSDLAPGTVSKRNFAASTLVSKFTTDADVVLSEGIRDPTMRWKAFGSRAWLQPFESLLPGEVPNEQCENSSNLITKDEILETKFNRLLLYSVVNGFAGLGDIPIASVIKFLSRHGNIAPLFREVLRASPKYVAKALAENLFKAAIEAQEERVIEQLLETRIFQINDIVCHFKGRKLTAVERATQLQNLRIIKLLLKSEADVVKTFSSETLMRGPLNHLASEILGYSGGHTDTLSEDVSNIIMELLRVGAALEVENLTRFLRISRDPDATFGILSAFVDAHSKISVSEGILAVLAEELDAVHAFELARKTLQIDQQQREGRCLKELNDHVEWALVQSAKKGHLQMVQLLLPLVDCLERALSAAFQSGSREVLNEILARKPDFNGPPHCLGHKRSDKTYVCSCSKTTPLAEAIGSQNDDLIDLCETAGALNHLHIDGYLQAALEAAAASDNLRYIRKIIQHHMPKPHEMYYALNISTSHGYVEVSLALLEAGAPIYLPQIGHGGGVEAPLVLAILQRNKRMVYAMLDVSITYVGWCHHMMYNGRFKRKGITSFLDEAIRWADASIILDIHSAFPDQVVSPEALEETLRAGDEELFTLMIENDLVRTESITHCLIIPIENGNVAMLIRLLELGADPANSQALAFAAQKNHRMLNMLLERIPESTGRVVGGLGKDAVDNTIKAGFAGLQALDALLSSKVIDYRSFECKFPYSSYYDGATDQYTPLGLAIIRAEGYQNTFPIVERLLEAGCDSNSVVFLPGVISNESNLTALLAAIKTKEVNLVKLLLNYGAKVNTEAKRRLSRTPLQLAAELGCLDIVQLLLDKGADVNAMPVERGGGTALQLAAVSGNCNIVAKLLEHGADLYASPSKLYGRWPIEGAAEHGRLDMLEYLFKLLTFPNPEQCKRAIELAEENGHIGCKELIQERINGSEMGLFENEGLFTCD